MKPRTKILVVIAVVVLAAASRLVKHPFNFTPVAAMSIFAGCYLKNKWGVILPIASMVVSDYFIGFYDWQVMVSVYFAIALAYAIGWYIRNKKWYFVPLGAIASSVIFFLVTNFAVWAFFDWYPHTWQGLITNFTMALPFFRNTLLGDIFYTGAFFGAFELVSRLAAKRAVKQATI